MLALTVAIYAMAPTSRLNDSGENPHGNNSLKPESLPPTPPPSLRIPASIASSMSTIDIPVFVNCTISTLPVNSDLKHKVSND